MSRSRSPRVSPSCAPSQENTAQRGALLWLDIVRDKWRPPVLLALWHAPNHTLRYGELLRGVEGISHTMLSRALHDLERGGLIERAVFACVPAKVEYNLSPLGCRFIEPMLSIGDWALPLAGELQKVHDKITHRVGVKEEA